MSDAVCARCQDALVDPEDVFCSNDCVKLQVHDMLRDLRLTVSRGTKDKSDDRHVGLTPPAWVLMAHWFYIIDLRDPETACFGTLADVERCIVDGGWPRPMSVEEGRTYAKQVDAITLWHPKRQRKADVLYDLVHGR